MSESDVVVEPAVLPTVGRIVVYKMTENDALAVNTRRKHAELSNIAGQRNGVQVHHGNMVVEGMEFPAIVVRVWEGAYRSLNLQVLLDGNDTLWVTSRIEGDGEGDWRWPDRS